MRARSRDFFDEDEDEDDASRRPDGEAMAREAPRGLPTGRRRRSGEMARHAATPASRASPRGEPLAILRETSSGDAASDAAESLEDVRSPPWTRAKNTTRRAPSRIVDREPRRACSATSLWHSSRRPTRAFSPTRERPDAMSATTVRVTAAHLCASAGFEPTASRCSNASDASLRRNKKTSQADASASFPSRRARATPTTPQAR